MGLELRQGSKGNYWGNDYNSSNALTQEQMEINATYIYSYLIECNWTINAIAGLLRKYEI